MVGGVREDVSVVIVSWTDPTATRRAVTSALAQSVAPAEIVVVDNAPGGPAASELSGLDVTILRPSRNLGFAGGVDLAAAQARAEWLLVLNPDVIAQHDAIERLLAVADDGVGVVGAQVLLPDGRVNAGANPVHLTGLSWAGRYLEAPEDGPPRDVASVSGAAMLVRKAMFESLGGFAPGFFVYQEDVDLCLRARAAGWTVRFCPAARVVHDYDFDKGAAKWFWLERNRLWTVLSDYDARTLLLLMPLLLAAEVAIVLSAVRGGWGREKLRAYCSLAQALPSLLRWRRTVQRQRVVPDAVLVRDLTATISTPVLDGPMLRAASPWMERYKALVLRALAAR